MLSSLDRLIDRTTMYRLVLYYLLALLGGAFLLGMARVVAIDPTALVFSTVLLLAASLGANLVFAAVFGAVPNRESASITALILALILDPVTATNLAGVGLLLFEPAGATSDMTIGLIDETMIRAKVPDFAERIFYISGPRVMVAAERRLLRRMGVPFWRIRTDFFPGLA